MLVAAHAEQDMEGVRRWSYGDKLYGMALEDIASGNLSSDCYGVIQYAGTLFMDADASVNAIGFNDPVGLNKNGRAVKHCTGSVIGYACESIHKGFGKIKVRVVK